MLYRRCKTSDHASQRSMYVCTYVCGYPYFHVAGVQCQYLARQVSLGNNAIQLHTQHSG